MPLFSQTSQNKVQSPSTSSTPEEEKSSITASTSTGKEYWMCMWTSQVSLQALRNGQWPLCACVVTGSVETILKRVRMFGNKSRYHAASASTAVSGHCGAVDNLFCHNSNSPWTTSSSKQSRQTHCITFKHWLEVCKRIWCYKFRNQRPQVDNALLMNTETLTELWDDRHGLEMVCKHFSWSIPGQSQSIFTR